MVQRRGPGVGAAQRRGVMARVDPPRNNTKHEGTVSIRADKDKDKESLCSYVHFKSITHFRTQKKNTHYVLYANRLIITSDTRRLARAARRSPIPTLRAPPRWR